jgi:hypothetical protein
MDKVLEFKWGVSKGRDTYGYNICSLYVDGQKVASTCGGGYDMEGTVLGNWIARAFNDELLKLEMPTYTINREEARGFYGLSFHDPNFDPGKAKPPYGPPVFGKEGDEEKTIEELEAENKSLGLERYQAFYAASSPVPTERHTVPLLDGACGKSEMLKVLAALGYFLQFISERKNNSTWLLKKKE